MVWRAAKATGATAVLAALLIGCSNDASDTGPKAGGGDPAGPDAVDEAPLDRTRNVIVATGSEVELVLGGAPLAVVVDETADCFDATCRQVVEFGSDNRWVKTDETGTRTEGTYDSATIADFASTVADDQLVTGPFNGECPTEFGGRERSYLVFLPEATEEAVFSASTCLDQLDAKAPLLVALDLLVVEADR